MRTKYGQTYISCGVPASTCTKPVSSIVTRIDSASTPSESGYTAFQNATGSLSSVNEKIGVDSFIRSASCCSSPLRAAARIRARVRATGGGRRDRSVMISGTGADGASGITWPVRLSSAAGAGCTGNGGELGDGLSGSLRTPPGASITPLAASVSTNRTKPMRSDMDRQPDPDAGSLPDRANRRRVFAAPGSDRMATDWRRVRGPRLDQTDRNVKQSDRALLFGGGQGEFAVADAHGQALGEMGRGLLAIGRHEFGEGGEQARLRQAVPVDTVDASLEPGFVQIAQRRSLLFMIRSVPRSLGRLCRHGPGQFSAESPRPLR